MSGAGSKEGRERERKKKPRRRIKPESDLNRLLQTAAGRTQNPSSDSLFRRSGGVPSRSHSLLKIKSWTRQQDAAAAVLSAAGTRYQQQDGGTTLWRGTRFFKLETGLSSRPVYLPFIRIFMMTFIYRDAVITARRRRDPPTTHFPPQTSEVVARYFYHNLPCLT